MQRIRSGENQKLMYETLLTKQMTLLQMIEAFPFGEKTIKQYLRLMTNKNQVLKDKTYKHIYYYANPKVPFTYTKHLLLLIAREQNKLAKQSMVVEKPVTPSHTQQVNAHTRVVRLMDKPMLNSTMPKKRASGSKYVSMGSGLSMFKNWE